jgi:hypothetical protein
VTGAAYPSQMPQEPDDLLRLPRGPLVGSSHGTRPAGRSLPFRRRRVLPSRAGVAFYVTRSNSHAAKHGRCRW